MSRHYRWPRPAKSLSKGSSSVGRFCTIYMRRAWVALKQTARRKVALEPNACMVSLLSCTQTKPRAPGRCRSWRVKRKRTFFSQKNILHEKPTFLRNQPLLRTNYARYRKQAAQRKPPTRRPPGLQLHLHQSYASQNFLLPKFVCIANTFLDEHAAQTTSVVLT